MSKRTLVLIVLLVVVSAGLIYTAAFQGKQQMQISSTPIVTPAPIGHTILSLKPANTAQNSTDLIIDSMGDNLTAVQAEIVYDATKITNVHVTQGTFFATPIVLFNQIDQKTGRISYAIAIQPSNQPQKGTGT